MTTTDNAVVLYQSPDGSSSLEVHLDHETVWLTQKQMAEKETIVKVIVNLINQKN